MATTSANLFRRSAYSRYSDDSRFTKEIRSPQNPFNEEISAVRIMNAVRTHARLHKNNRPPVFSP